MYTVYYVVYILFSDCTNLHPFRYMDRKVPSYSVPKWDDPYRKQRSVSEKWQKLTRSGWF